MLINEYIKECYDSLYQYIESVKSGAIVSNVYIKQAVTRYEILLTLPHVELNKKKFERVLKFLFFINIRDKKTGLTLQFKPLPYQLFIIYNVYGFYYANSDIRLYNKVFLFMAKKNGKSTFISILTLYNALGDNEIKPECYILANTVKQANDDLDIIKDLVDSSPVIKQNLDLLQYSIRLKHDKGGKIKTLAKNIIKNIDGVNASSFILDEAWGYDSDEALSFADSSTVNRKNPLIFIISTAGSIVEGFLSDMIKQAKNILNGDEQNERFFSLLYCLDESDSWKNSNMWEKANPSLNQTVDLSKLKELYTSALSSKTRLNDFLNKHLNVFTNTVSSWIDSEYLTKCFKPLNINDFLGCECWVGMDLSANRDMSAVSILFKKENIFYSFNKVFKTLDDGYNENANRFKLEKWIQAGYIHQFNSIRIDYNEIADYLLDISKRFKIKSVGYDANNSQLIIPKLIENGIKTNVIGQTSYNFNFPLKFLDKNIIENTIYIDDNPCILWQFGNVRIYTDTNSNIKIIKNKNRDSVDSIVAIAESMCEYVRLNYNIEKAQTGVWFNHKKE